MNCDSIERFMVNDVGCCFESWCKLLRYCVGSCLRIVNSESSDVVKKTKFMTPGQVLTRILNNFYRNYVRRPSLSSNLPKIRFFMT